VRFIAAQTVCAAAAIAVYRLSATTAVWGLGALTLAWAGLLAWFLRRPTQEPAEAVGPNR
jgi:hypothetical protein